jgi:hypothetical protein
MACPTGKHRFATEHLAQVALVEAVMKANRGNQKRRECRHYHCDRCRGWHLTSRPVLKPITKR